MDGSLPSRLLSPWDFFPGTNAGVGCHILLQEIFPTQGSNLHPALAVEFFTSSTSLTSLRQLICQRDIFKAVKILLPSTLRVWVNMQSPLSTQASVSSGTEELGTPVEVPEQPEP